MCGMWLWWLMAIVAVAAVAWSVARKSRNEVLQDESPEQILKRRYAKGEIDSDNYERMLVDLKK